jgi:hypothetical protein
MELRLFGANWESAIMEVSLLQIVLSELVGVPTSVETGTAAGRINLYDPFNSYQYGNVDDLASLTRANAVGDCRMLRTATAAAAGDRISAAATCGQYEACAHVATEIWDPLAANVQENIYNGTVESKPLGGMFLNLVAVFWFRFFVCLFLAPQNQGLNNAVVIIQLNLFIF